MPGPAPVPEVAQVRFDGFERVPVVSAKDVVIVYVGPLAPFTADDLARHPELKDYPVIELAPEKPLAKGVRYAPLYRIPGGFLGFGESRVKTAMLAHPVPAEAMGRPPRHSRAANTPSAAARLRTS